MINCILLIFSQMRSFEWNIHVHGAQHFSDKLHRQKGFLFVERAEEINSWYHQFRKLPKMWWKGQRDFFLKLVPGMWKELKYNQRHSFCKKKMVISWKMDVTETYQDCIKEICGVQMGVDRCQNCWQVRSKSVVWTGNTYATSSLRLSKREINETSWRPNVFLDFTEAVWPAYCQLHWWSHRFHIRYDDDIVR